MTTQIHATAERGNGWWVVAFSVDGTEFGTQAKRLDQINDMVADAASLMTGRPESDFIIDYEVTDARYVDLVNEYKIRAHEALEAEHEAASASRRAVAAMREDGLPLRDVASMMGISPQRVSQLAHA